MPIDSQFQLAEGEFRFASLIWNNEPIPSGELTKLALKQLGWKKSTSYTVLRKLCEKGLFQNVNTIVTSLVPQEQVQHLESQRFVQRAFNGSLPSFVAAFLADHRLSHQEAEELQHLIDCHREDSP